MGNQLVESDSISSLPQEESYIGEGAVSSSPHPYRDAFERLLPFYMSIGMTPDEFWDQDCSLVRFYREAEKLRNKKQNQMMWIQGAYIYEAIARMSPILNSNAKKGTKADPWLEAPFPMDEEDEKAIEKKKAEVKQAEARRFMETWAANTNKHFNGGA